MRTTLILSDELIQEAIKITGINEKTKLIHLSLEELIRKRKLQELANLYGAEKKNKLPQIKRGR